MVVSGEARTEETGSCPTLTVSTTVTADSKEGGLLSDSVWTSEKGNASTEVLLGFRDKLVSSGGVVFISVVCVRPGVSSEAVVRGEKGLLSADVDEAGDDEVTAGEDR